MINLEPYRQEIIDNDRWHKSVALILSLLAVGLTIAFQLTSINELLTWSMLLVVSAVGAIIRLEVMVHRLSAFVQANGDAWENFRANLKFDKAYLSVADAIMMAPLVYALYYYFAYSESALFAKIFFGVLLSAEVLLWATASKMVRKSRLEEIENEKK